MPAVRATLVLMRLVILLLGLLLASCSRTPESPKPAKPRTSEMRKPRPSPYPPEFWTHWRDGKSEVSVYEVTLPGASAKGTLITVFSLERLSNSRRVKADRYQGSDVFPVMKMNMIREHAPGSGDTLSVFAALEPVNGQAFGGTTKIVYSDWGWTGPVWRQLLLTGKHTRLSWHSYLEQEADGQSTRDFWHPHLVPEDALALCARRIAWPILTLGETNRFDTFGSISTPAIHTDQPAVLTLTLPRDRHTTVVPAGSFRTHTFTAKWLKSQRTKTWDVEADPPHRIVRWQTSTGETAALSGSGRFDEKEIAGKPEKALQRLGLQPQARVP